MATAARRGSHIGCPDAPHPAAEEVTEDLRLSKLVDLVWEEAVVVEDPHSLREATVRSLVVWQTALVAAEERGEALERPVVGPREVVVGPGLLRRREAPSRRYLVGHRGSRIGLISAHSFGQPRRLEINGACLF